MPGRLEDPRVLETAKLLDTHNQFTAVGFLVNVGKSGEGPKELHNALFLPQKGILLESLLNHLAELLGLRKDNREGKGQQSVSKPCLMRVV